MIRIKITMSFLGLLLAGGILLSSCSQDDIFYTIQYDKVLNKDAAIPGSPGRIIELGDALYTGSNAVYEYKKPEIDGEAASWQQLPAQPGGKRILDLTGTDTYLYALVMQGVHLSDSGLYRKNPKEDGEWKWVANLTGYPIQSLWGAGDVLFAGARAGNGNYVLLYVNDSEGTPTLSQVSDVSGMLKAAAKVGNSYYVAIEGKGLVDLANPAVVLDVATDIVGLIEISGSLIAVSRGGLIYLIDSDGNVTPKSVNASLNGVLAKWKDPVIKSGNETDLLLLGNAVPGGNSSATYYYGYSEFPITFSGTTPELGSALQAPGLPGGNASTSVSKNESYYTTLGTHPVVSLYQAPWDLVLFAATQQDGLWSCRQRDDPKEWNIE